ncbi:MAG: alkaline phosphatase family protein [Clostridia bacterium]|nr:alkaline phosphatase family protein [Clostridia bacterium]
MKKKVILISIDGMRPDGFLGCKNPYVKDLLEMSTHSMTARSQDPSVTLPCHMSIFLSVSPERHGILTNTYVPPVRPVKGLFEVLKSADKKCGMFYGWEELRDVSRPGSLDRAEYVESYSAPSTDTVLTDRAISYIKEEAPDFVFLYLVETDTKGGHDVGWMTETYLEYISVAVDCTKKVVEAAGEDYTVIVTADHGGHARGHGADIPEDMIIPMLFIGQEFEKGKEITDISLLDIAPTVAKIMGVPPQREWEGTPIC